MFCSVFKGISLRTHKDLVFMLVWQALGTIDLRIVVSMTTDKKNCTYKTDRPIPDQQPFKFPHIPGSLSKIIAVIRFGFTNNIHLDFCADQPVKTFFGGIFLFAVKKP
jgi:hypothetical protein